MIKFWLVVVVGLGISYTASGQIDTYHFAFNCKCKLVRNEWVVDEDKSYQSHGIHFADSTSKMIVSVVSNVRTDAASRTEKLRAQHKGPPWHFREILFQGVLLAIVGENHYVEFYARSFVYFSGDKEVMLIMRAETRAQLNAITNEVVRNFRLKRTPANEKS